MLGGRPVTGDGFDRIEVGEWVPSPQGVGGDTTEKD